MILVFTKLGKLRFRGFVSLIIHMPQKVRLNLRSVVPEAIELISYQVV
jgi:hypothetical protein